MEYCMVAAIAAEAEHSESEERRSQSEEQIRWDSWHMEIGRTRSLVLEEETVFVACWDMVVATQGTTKTAQERKAFVLEVSHIAAAEVAP
jgi:hypothetical protein